MEERDTEMSVREQSSVVVIEWKAVGAGYLDGLQ